ncbi:MAG: Serine/threonine protein kinase PrkC, regulator of stationary phase [Myxococcaceae bacterium]|nr:Serine/threonine protein kinase PrkC, regulator of stationary phase [Myxococcaceae bacterium]
MPVVHGDDVTGVVTSPGMDPLVGQVLDGRFKVVEPIGTGGMGRVYRAVQQPLNRAVALKVLDYNYGAGKDEAFRQRFLVEAALTAKLSHPNTITVIDYGCTPKGIFYIAMEYLDGRTLDQVVSDDGPIEWRRVLNIGQQVCRSLREAHNLGVVHRDLKPGNVMLLHADDDTDQVKVLDFGLVKSFVVGQELEGRAITQQGMLMGSPPYMAPEQGEKNHADPRSDIYSLGTVLYEALTGAPPFTGKSAMEVILKHVHQPVPPMRVTGEPVPAEMEALVFRCLAKSPMDRFQSMDEVLQALQELATPQQFATPTAGIPIQEEPVRTSGRLMPLVLFVVAVALGAVVASSVIRSLRPENQAAPVGPPSLTPVPAPQELVVAPPEQQIAQEPTPDEVEAEPEPEPEPVKAEPVRAEPVRAELVKAEPVTVRPVKKEPTPAEPVKPEPAKVAAPAPTWVTFRVETEPRGARVLLEGKLVGRTPVDVQVPIPASGTAHAELALSLGGYQPTTVSASGERGRVVVSEKLRPLSAKPITGPPTAAAVKKKPAAKKPTSVGSPAKLDDEDDEGVATPPPPGDVLKKPAP